MTTERKLSRFGQRHVLVLLANLGVVLVYCMRVNLSVALVAMVNNTETKNGSKSDECPQEMTNTSAHSLSPSGSEFQWSRQEQGFILSAFYWGYILLQIPAGTLAQRYGAKWIFGIGIVWTAVLTLLTPLVARISVYLFIALRFLEGLGESSTFPAILAMLGRWSPREENSLMFSLVTFGTALGAILGQATAGPLCASTLFGGWPSVFYISGGLGLVWIIPWYFLVFDSPEKHPRISEEEKNYILNSIGTSQEETNKRSIPWKRILLSRYVWSYVIVKSIAGLVSSTLLTCLPQFLSDVLNFKISENGIVASSPYISYVALSNVYAWISDMSVSRNWIGKTNIKKIFTLVSLGGCGACLFAITLLSCNKVMVIVLLVASHGLYSACNGGYATVALDLSPEYSGTIFGVANLVTQIFSIVTPLLTDAITVHGTIQEWNIVFYISTGACAFGMLQFTIFGSAERQDWNVDTGALTEPFVEKDGSDESPLIVNDANIL